jgi:hypothetical protein
MPFLPDPYWLPGTAIMILKEYVAVLAQLVCFSRVMLPDFFTGPLILFMTLVVFAFPFLSSYLFLLLRFGPWAPGGAWPRVVGQTVGVIGAQLLGALTAAYVVKTHGYLWSASTMTENSETVFWLYRSADDQVHPALPGLEEACCVGFFLVGLLHLMEEDPAAQGLLVSAFWHGKKDEETQPVLGKQENPLEKIEEQLVGISSTQTNIDLRLRDIAEKQSAMESKLMVASGRPVLDPLPLRPLPARSNQQNFGSLLSPTTPKNPSPPTPIPTGFILHVCILLAATSRAFPTAHGTPAVTLYVAQMGFCSAAAAWSRVVGGFIGAGVALGYYWALYVRPRESRTPAFLYSEMKMPDGWGER